MNNSIFHLLVAIQLLLAAVCAFDDPPIDKEALRKAAHEMFMHGYQSYMTYAYPHDELMPLSCKGRIRGVTPSRGDVDDSLGNFSLTLVDTLDTLVVVGEYDEFEKVVKLVVENVRFDNDIVVSVFETNIRMVGGLIGAHMMALAVKSKFPSRLVWYDHQLVDMAKDIADRLLPAFNTTSGLPYSRINLKRGMLPFLKEQRDTCTACGGTMILEMAVLSRLTGNSIYEEKARKAMDFLWERRHRGTDLMGTVLNVNSGDWVRRDSGIGAGIDSYYEYCLKAYILLDEEHFLDRFNTHYSAIMRYVNKGPLFIDVHMHKPTVASRSFMDALLAFWPGLLVLKGDLQPAIETHEMLYQVVKKHKFLPEAFTHDLQVHWAQHPLRPEFIESTYLLYRATKDEHYLHVAKQVLESLNENVRVPCGFAGVKDVRSMSHEDRMDSFVLSETFKYLYLIFAESSDLIFDPDNYVLSTEAHFLPLNLVSSHDQLPRRLFIEPEHLNDEERNKQFQSACPVLPANDVLRSPSELNAYGNTIRNRVQTSLGYLAKDAECAANQNDRLRAWAFSASNSDHIRHLNQMGIQMEQKDGQLLLSYNHNEAESEVMARAGIVFMEEFKDFAALYDTAANKQPKRIVQVISEPHLGALYFSAAPSNFGSDLSYVDAELVLAMPLDACSPLSNGHEVPGKIVVVLRSKCMFQEKARHAQNNGATGVIILDNNPGSNFDPFFAMSGGESDDPSDIRIPVVMLFNSDGKTLLRQVKEFASLRVRVAELVGNPAYFFEQFLRNPTEFSRPDLRAIDMSSQNPIALNVISKNIEFRFHFAEVNAESLAQQKQRIVEDNIEVLSECTQIAKPSDKEFLLNVARTLAYGELGFDVTVSTDSFQRMSALLPKISVSADMKKLRLPVVTVKCSLDDSTPKCNRL